MSSVLRTTCSTWEGTSTVEQVETEPRNKARKKTWKQEYWRVGARTLRNPRMVCFVEMSCRLGRVSCGGDLVTTTTINIMIMPVVKMLPPSWHLLSSWTIVSWWPGCHHDIALSSWTFLSWWHFQSCWHLLSWWCSLSWWSLLQNSGWSHNNQCWNAESCSHHKHFYRDDSNFCVMKCHGNIWCREHLFSS